MKKMLVFLILVIFASAVDFPREKGPRFTGKGDPKALLARYLAWQKRQSGQDALVFALRGGEGSKLIGAVKLALLQGRLELKLTQALDQPHEVWLLGRGHELKLATLAPGTRELAQDLNALLLPQNFALQAVVLTQAGDPPSLAQARGGPSLFARLYYAHWGQKLQLAGVEEEKPKWTKLLPKPALAASPEDEQALEALVAEGRRIFHEETFGGNGRTCGTCHREDNNFTLDPAYIAKLKPMDPLFVHERDPKLKDLEHSALLRQMALIQANVDGFDKPPVLRGVPHLLSLATSSAAEEEDLGTIAQSTGWSGDGAPGDGSLRMFAVGAVRQHLTRSLARVEGVDFRLPTEFELDALEAYMLSLGRQQDPDLKKLTFFNPIVERGKQLFDTKQNPVAGGKPIFGTTANCNGCHMNAGGLSSTTFANPIRDTGIENMPDQPHRLADPSVAHDGGFGRQLRQCGPQLDHPCYGDGRFSTPTAIEAADTPPFFHNNSVNTIEQAVAAYTGPAFNNSPGALTSSGANRQVILDGSQTTAVALFLRAINVVENIDSSNRLNERAMALNDKELAKKEIALALSDSEDAVEVLEGAVYNIYPEALIKLKKACDFEKKAMAAASSANRNRLLARAIRLKTQARDLIVATR